MRPSDEFLLARRLLAKLAHIDILLHILQFCVTYLFNFLIRESATKCSKSRFTVKYLYPVEYLKVLFTDLWRPIPYTFQYVALI